MPKKLDAIFGMPTFSNEGRQTATSSIMFMELPESTISLLAENATLPETGQPVVRLALSADIDGKQLLKELYVPPASDLMVMLWHACIDSTDYFVDDVVTPFVAEMCRLKGCPMIRVIKPDPPSLIEST